MMRPLPERPLSDARFVLATDLDGTFLGGTRPMRKRLYDWIEANRETVGLIFVTGRDPGFILQMCTEKGLPWPEYVVGDVGTTIAEVRAGIGLCPIDALEAQIAEIWGDAGETVRAALADAPGLTLQETEFRYRVSYDLDPATFDPATKETVAALGHDVLISDNRYFDVLPKGISKGPSIQRLVDHLGIPPELVLTAGDTLNDFSMLASGLQAVAVGGSETALLERLPKAPHIHRATAIGAAGILEAIAYFDLHDAPKGH
ncbi:MAG: HAD-IIB family hydrolase [Pseudomonadota bacterium]